MKKERNIRLCSVILMGMFLIPANSCKKVGDPIITTTALKYITQTTATCGGNITGDGGAAITARGVCWSTNPTPSIAENKTTDNTGTGSFPSLITGLTANTTYYERAYATNSAGTGYGNVVSFTTPGSVSDIDGNGYSTVVIGTQVWMVENLKTTRYRNGNPIQNITDSTQWNKYLNTGAYCSYRNDINYANTYGHLYNWYAVNDSRNIAPEGWHIPSNVEWATLATFLGSGVAGGKLKEAGTTHWASPNTGATNETGFTALPGGYRDGYSGMFIYISIYNYLWSSTGYSQSIASCQIMYCEEAFSGEGFFEKLFGFSVRCIKD